MLASLIDALADIGAALRLRRVWIALASEDIGDQHKRTTLGPLWLLINYLSFAGTFILFFNTGSGDGSNYPAYVATGLLVWFYIMEIFINGVALFVREESFIKGTTLPLSVYVMRLVMHSVIRAGYAALGCLAILFMTGADLSLAWIWSFAGVVLILATTPAVIIICAFLGAWFPDSQFIVGNIMRIGMFLTPVFWHYSDSGGAQLAFYYWNPFTYFLEIVREPILSGSVPIKAFALCLIIAAGNWVIALMLLGRYRKQVVFFL